MTAALERSVPHLIPMDYSDAITKEPENDERLHVYWINSERWDVLNSALEEMNASPHSVFNVTAFETGRKMLKRIHLEDLFTIGRETPKSPFTLLYDSRKYERADIYPDEKNAMKGEKPDMMVITKRKDVAQNHKAA